MTVPHRSDSMLSALFRLYPVMTFEDGGQLSQPVEIAATAEDDRRPGRTRDLPTGDARPGPEGDDSTRG